MQALEMEDDEVERFLDSQEAGSIGGSGRGSGVGGSSNGFRRIGSLPKRSNVGGGGSSSSGGGGAGGGVCGSIWRKVSMGKILVALAVISAVAVFALSGAGAADGEDELPLGEQQEIAKKKPPHHPQPTAAPAPPPPAEKKPAPPPPPPPPPPTPAPVPQQQPKPDKGDTADASDDGPPQPPPPASTGGGTDGDADQSQQQEQQQQGDEGEVGDDEDGGGGDAPAGPDGDEEQGDSASPGDGGDGGDGGGDDGDESSGSGNGDIEGSDGEELPDDYPGGDGKGDSGGDGSGEEEPPTPDGDADGADTDDADGADDADDEGGEEVNNRVYSRYATIVPDPYYSPSTKDDDAAKEELIDKYGKWTFFDGDESSRPTGDYLKGYDNGDMPADDFPDEAWQADAVFVNHILDAGENLVDRAMEAIYAEYGRGKDTLDVDGQAERLKWFRWETVDFGKSSEPPPNSKAKGGWTTNRSFSGIVRRLLHAMHVNDEFVIAVVGHGGPSGYGNHFHQSYPMRMHEVLSPVFARMGVKLVVRNLAQAGMGTIHHALGFRDLVGEDVDVLIWDCDTEDLSDSMIDLLFRQALMSQRKVPFILGGNYDVLRTLHEEADVDVADFGLGTEGVPVTEDENQAAALPRCARYLHCAPDQQAVCESDPERFCTSCFLPRDDLKAEELFKSISEKPAGQESVMTLGWKQHQLIGRSIAFSILDALQEALHIWSDGTMGGPPLDEDEWHVTDYYENIRDKVKALQHTVGECYKVQQRGIPGRVCWTPMQGRGLHTPRYKPTESSIVSIVRPTADGKVPTNKRKVMYDGPDGHNQCYDIPEGEVDVLAIITNRRNRRLHPRYHQRIGESRIHNGRRNSASRRNQRMHRELDGEDIAPGELWEVVDEKPGDCDGGYYSICGRDRQSSCPAQGSHDSRGALVGNEDSGWVVFDLPDVTDGIILLRFVSAKEGEKSLPESFSLEFAINGEVTTWTKEEFDERTGRFHDLVEVATLLDDENFSAGPKVELAVRALGCPADTCAFGIPNIYWA